MGSAHEYDRREVLRRALAVGLAAVPASSLLSACATAGGGDRKTGKRAVTGRVSAKNPLGVAPGAPLEAFVFKGGFGDQYVIDAEADYRKEFPEATIKHTGTQQLGPKLTPRFVGGDPPDVMDNSGADNLDTPDLVAQGRLVDLTPLLDAPSFDMPGKQVRDTLIPGTVEQGQYGSSAMYALNYAFTVFGTWYSQKLLQDRGWEYPKTFDEMLALCARIKKAGIAPWAYAGKYPYYVHFVLFPQIGKIGGQEVLRAIDNLEPNAWKADAVRQTLEFFEEMAAKGYFLRGTEGLTHIQSQTAWTKGQAVFVPNGSWVENEAKPTTPADFRMGVGPLLSAGSSDAMPYGTIYAAAGEPYIVAKDGRNPAGGMELLRIMLSKKHARDFSRLVSCLTCVRGATDGMSLPPGLTSADAMLKAAGSNVVNPRITTDWYPKLSKETIGGATMELLTGRIRADEWIRRAQKASDETRRDDSVKKFKR